MSAGGRGGAGRRLVVEADGGSRGNPGPAGYGALVRDALTGEVLSEVAEAIGEATNNVAEYRGLIAGLSAASVSVSSATSVTPTTVTGTQTTRHSAAGVKRRHASIGPMAVRSTSTSASGVTRRSNHGGPTLASVPVIASGGAGGPADFAPAVAAGADAVLAASIFHSGQCTIGEVKDAMREAGVTVR